MSVSHHRLASKLHGQPWRGLAVPLLVTCLPGVLAFALPLVHLIWTGKLFVLGLSLSYLAIIGLVLAKRHSRIACRLAQRAWRFPSLQAQHVVLRVDPRLQAQARAIRLLHSIEQNVGELAQQFGRNPRRPITVFLFASQQEVSAVYGKNIGGFAFCGTAVVADTHLPQLLESIRHELAHLFMRPSHEPLLSEGFAVWWQRTRNSIPIDEAAMPLLRRRALSFPAVLKWHRFHDEALRSDCYILAGSFTGFLIRRLGWRAYRRFYRTALNYGIRKALKRHLGLTLEQAEARWRVELSMVQILRRRAGGLRP